jgi:hypothetical protein
VKIVIRIAIALAALAGFLFLFLRSAQNVLSEPYVVARQHTEPWTLAVDTAALPSSPLVVARPPPQFGRELLGQIFSRMRESLRGARDAGVPVILRAEYALSLAGRYTPQDLLDAARAAGLESAAFTPVCVAVRRISEPGLTRELYFVIVESPAVLQFRRQIAASLDPQAAATFDPASLSLLLMIGGTDVNFERSMPTSATAEADCVAPIEID